MLTPKNNGEQRVDIGGYKIDAPEAVGGVLMFFAIFYAGLKRFMQMGIGQEVADQVREISEKLDDARLEAQHLETKIDHMAERLTDHFRDDDRRFGELLRRIPSPP